MTTLKNQILDISRQNNIGTLSPWFDRQLDALITKGFFKTETALAYVAENIIERLRAYGEASGLARRGKDGRPTVVLGMSGGVDSALTAALFKKAGYRVIGVTLPIFQNPEETKRGEEAIEALGLEGLTVDLSDAYSNMLVELADVDPEVTSEEADDTAVRIRRGNIRARLRMITLYNLASKYNGLVASTDNFSELASGFWTLHGDVGDLSPIQSLLKSWEVPMLAKMVGVPESTWRAKPTDGLGVAGGDEDQFGCSYLELDILLGSMEGKNIGGTIHDVTREIDMNAVSDMQKAANVLVRISSTWFKRVNPINLPHPLVGSARYDLLRGIDENFSAPAAFTALK